MAQFDNIMLLLFTQKPNILLCKSRELLKKDFLPFYKRTIIYKMSRPAFILLKKVKGYLSSRL